MRYDIQQIGLWWNTFVVPNGGVEIRSIADRTNCSVYLKAGDWQSVENTVKSMFEVYHQNNIYFVLNQIDEDCYSREQYRQIHTNCKITTNDNDIVRRKWVLIDFDPVRRTGVSSTDEQLELAYKKATEVYNWLTMQGFMRMVVAMSGNGYHILIPIDIANNRETAKAVEYFLKSMSMFFSDESIDIDKKVFNASRICKLYGTLASKGQSTERNPHRMSRLIQVPSPIVPNDFSLIEKIASVAQAAEKPQTTYRQGQPYKKFELEEWLNDHGIGYKRETYNGSSKFVLDHCPFNPEHKGKDAVIFQGDDGAISFHCFHNSCDGKTWRDVRLMYEPDAYSHGYELPSQQRQRQRAMSIVQEQPEMPKDTPFWYRTDNFPKYEYSDEDYIKSGYRNGIDNKIRGFRRGQVSVWSGSRGCGKSSLLNMLTLNAINEKYKVAIWSGELNANDIMQWFYLQAAGWYTVQSGYYRDFYTVPDEVKQRINEWAHDYLFIANNDYGSQYAFIAQKVNELAEAETKIDVLIIDNLMTLDIQGMSEEGQYTDQKALMLKLHQLADVLNIHIHIVCHPNKQMGFLRMNHISGTGNIADLAQNVFIMHRVNEDFWNGLKQFNTKMCKSLEEGFPDDTNVIEICKCRDKGTVANTFVHLKFVAECNQLVEISEGGGWKVREYDWNKQNLTSQPRKKTTFDNKAENERYRSDQDEDAATYEEGTGAFDKKPTMSSDGRYEITENPQTGITQYRDIRTGDILPFPPEQANEPY